MLWHLVRSVVSSLPPFNMSKNKMKILVLIMKSYKILLVIPKSSIKTPLSRKAREIICYTFLIEKMKMILSMRHPIMSPMIQVMTALNLRILRQRKNLFQKCQTCLILSLRSFELTYIYLILGLNSDCR